MILMESQLIEADSGFVEDTVAFTPVLPNRYIFSVILESQRHGKTCLPFHLGLSYSNYLSFKEYLYDDWAHLFVVDEPDEDIRQELLSMRGDEWMDLRALLTGNRNRQIVTEIWMAEIVSAACLGGDHLWRDLGLPDRRSLSVLLDNNFHQLAKNNTKDMKWKKFFYKQLCEQGGGYVCRAPSCEQCKAYDDCFGLEE